MATADRTLDDDTESSRRKARARKRASEEPPPERRREAPREAPEDDGRRHEVLGLFSLAATVLSGLALFSYDARGLDNAIGFVGQALAGVLASAFGLAAWFVPLELALLTGRLFRRTRSRLGVARLASTIVVVLVGCALLHLALPADEVMGGHLPGGLVGEVLGELMRSLFGLVGALVVGLTLLLVTLVLRTSLSVVGVGRQVVGAAKRSGEKARDGIGQVAEALRTARELELREREEERLRNQPKIVLSGGSSAEVLAPGEEAASAARRSRAGAGEASMIASGDSTLDDASLAPPSEGERAEGAALDEREEVEDASLAPAAAEEAAEERGEVAEAPERSGLRVAASSERPARERARARAEGPTIVPPKLELPPRAAETPRGEASKAPSSFVLPPPTLLDPPKTQALAIDEAHLRENAERLVEKLNAYGVRGRIDEIHPGPVVTMYELEPESGTKLSKIASLADDLAMAMAAQKVRIVAPIPGKARVGFELPNRERQMVSLREILEDPRWNEARAALPVAFGKDIAGQPVYGDLSKMPHLLVAGATGAGKSVGLNVMLASLLMKRTPDDVRLLMIDPKVVELAVFDGIPHMLLPVVTDMKKASLALRWAVDEMERRYQLFADAGARNITTYNERVDKVLRGELAPEKLAPRKAEARGAAPPQPDLGDEDAIRAFVEADQPLPPPTRLPYVVVVVDEFADLMMVAAKDVEAAIARLAQKARAAGIHVILATQRPSVDVITGMIKANFPARIAFKVSQREDSKTILGRIGAEHLLGAGDMLMIPPGASDLKRVHSAFIGEDEVQAVCDHLRAQGSPVYDERITAPREDDEGEPEADGGGGGSGDGLYDKAVATVATAGYCSISHLQRQLGVGYNKAAKLVERMEKEGVVGPPSGKAGGRREVLVSAA